MDLSQKGKFDEKNTPLIVLSCSSVCPIYCIQDLLWCLGEFCPLLNLYLADIREKADLSAAEIS